MLILIALIRPRARVQVPPVIVSLMETAKANGLEPLAYIRHVLLDIANADTLEKIEALWEERHCGSVLHHQRANPALCSVVFQPDH